MLIRVSGGVEGIADYLTYGQMRGRFFSRDELDKRLVLAGHLEIANQLIAGAGDSKGNAAERYNHITLSFREDYVAPEVLQQIAEEFRAFTFAAYDPEEYHYYAEAHLPRIKSYHDARTGKLIDRKPHIHVVIPRINLIDGKGLNPLGLVKFTERYLDAFQELINEKYGFASPKDNRRSVIPTVEVKGRAECLARYTGIEFAGQGSEVKKKLLERLASLPAPVNDITQVAAIAKEFGRVAVRNEGTDRAYLNIRVPGAAKGINLKEAIFRPSAALQTGEKVTKIDRIALLKQWSDVASKETRYLQRAGRWYRDIYKPADSETRKALLAEKEKQRHEQQRKYKSVGFSGTGVYGPLNEALRTADDLLQSATEHSRVAFKRGGARARRDVAQSLHGILSASQQQAERDLINPSNGLAPQLVADQTQVNGSDGFTPADASVLCEVQRSQRASTVQIPDPDRVLFAEIRKNLAGDFLLRYLNQTHGLNVDRYILSVGRDGGTRLRSVDSHRNLNVSDFLTRELHLPFDAAGPLLKGAYALQLQAQPLDRRPSVNSLLVEQYKREREADSLATQAMMKSVRDDGKKGLASSYKQFLVERGKLLGDKSVKGLQRLAGMSCLRMERALRDQAIRAKAKDQYKALRSGHVPFFAGYLVWLEQRTNSGDEASLLELRRMSLPKERTDSDCDLRGVNSPNVAPLQFPGLSRSYSYLADRKGDISWNSGQNTVLIDRVDRVTVLDRHSDHVELAIRIARQRFRGPLQVGGSEEFQRQVVEAAVRAGLKIDFINADLRAYQRGLQRRPSMAQRRILADATKNDIGR